jgi:PAS domain S-box-containing protein
MVRRHVESVHEGGSAQDVICRVITNRGVTYPTNWTLSRVSGEKTVYAVGRVLDEESERRRRLSARAGFFSLSPDLFVISDDRGYAAQVNQAWTTLLGWTPEDVIGKPFYDFVHPDDVAKASSAGRRALLREPVLNLAVRMRCKDGAYRSFDWTLTHVPGEHINYGIGRELE